ncbi:MAG: zinc-dependent peptidase [Gemmatimonadales bacterium]|jgi:Mlc titration factor MtfA (ptsG expression regulator)|nr:zinc-dependent peptidase [Gemmatimonadales bacterium]
MNRLTRALRKLLSRLLAAPVRLPTDPIPASWPDLLARQVPLAARLAPADRARLFRIMQLFLREVEIEGCAGLEVTEEIRVTIAAQACLLLLKMPYPRYARLRHVLVYPAAFVPRTVALHATGQIVRPDVPLRGQAWQSGVVVLGWDEVRRDTVITTDGENVVLHEFAHMLDAEDGRMDGMPVLDSGTAYRAWAALLTEEFAEHVARTERGESTALSPYGATNRAEFFAVATETFFERPLALRAEEPALYALLADFYQLDPGVVAPPSGGGP